MRPYEVSADRDIGRVSTTLLNARYTGAASVVHVVARHGARTRKPPTRGRLPVIAGSRAELRAASRVAGCSSNPNRIDVNYGVPKLPEGSVLS